MNGHSRNAAAVVLALFAAGSAAAAEYEAPVEVRQSTAAVFVSQPRAAAAVDTSAVPGQAGIKITFAISATTDVEVAILNSSNRVVRHLAAGLLGANAPEPFKKNSLAQEVFWDGRNDAGKPVADGALKVRVRLGLQPRLDKILGRAASPLNSRICAITASPKGELFILQTDLYRGRAEILVLDRNGRYLRTIMPYAADTPELRTEPVGHVKIDGHRQPLVFNGQSHSFYPLTAGLRYQTMAWHPDGYLLAASAIGTMSDQGPPRHLIAFHPDGGAPEKVGFAGPQIRKPLGFLGGWGEGWAMGKDRLAVSPDGQWIYLVLSMQDPNYEKRKERVHGVYRVKWTDKELGAPWLGKKAQGPGDDEFTHPQGLAVDKAGRLYVCDQGNNRIKLYQPDGTLLGQFSVPEPEQIAVHPASGEIYLFCKTGKLMKFSAWKDAPPTELASLLFDNKARGPELMSLDASAEQPRVWMVLRTEQSSSLVAVDDAGGTLKEGLSLPAGYGASWLHDPSFIAADPERDRVIVYEKLAQSKNGYWVIGIESGRLRRPEVRIRGSDLAVDPDGNIYVIDSYGSHTMSRYGPDFNPLPFAATGVNKFTKVWQRSNGPDMGLRGHCIAPNGDIYVRISPNNAAASTVDVWGPDGTKKKDGLVNGASSSDTGIGVDNRGNLYLGTNLKTKDRLIPGDFTNAVPTVAWRYYTMGQRYSAPAGKWKEDGKDERLPPWTYVYDNPYIFDMGSVFKFGREGGTFYGNFNAKNFPNPAITLDKAPADATSYKSGYLTWNVKVEGVKWRYPGIGVIPAPYDAFQSDDGCVCAQSQLDADPYGRVYAPSVFYSSVEMLDPAGNRIARIGSYGNADSAGPASRVPQPEIAFAWPTDCDYAEFDGRLYVTDSVNRRVMVIRFDAAATGVCDLK